MTPPLSWRSIGAGLLLALGLSVMTSTAVWATDPINTTFFGNKAIKGYDPVAYFTDRAPVKGNKQITLEWQGANWYFASTEHRDLFAAEPEQYAPRYGGYCAYAAAFNKIAGIDPDEWTIVDGKLYLNYSARVQKKWLKDRDHFIVEADRLWPGLLEK